MAKTTRTPAQKSPPRATHGPKNAVGPGGPLPPYLPSPNNSSLDATEFANLVGQATSLLKDADATKGFHVARFTGTDLCFNNGLVGINTPFVGLPGVAVQAEALIKAAVHCQTLGEPLTLVVDDNKLLFKAGDFTARLALVDYSLLPALPSVPQNWTLIDPSVWDAVFRVRFAMSRSALDMISLRGIALQNGKALAGTHSLLAAIPSQLPSQAQTLLMDQFLTVIRDDAKGGLPPEACFNADRAWIRSDDKTTVWGLLPAVPWPDGAEAAIISAVKAVTVTTPKAAFADKRLLCDTLGYLANLGIDKVEVQTADDPPRLRLTALSSGGQITQVAPLDTVRGACTFQVNPTLFKKAVAETDRFAYNPDSGILTFLAADGLTVILGAIR